MNAPATTAALVVGLGNSDRGDDGVGRAVAGSVAALGLADILVIEHEDPSGLLDLIAGRPVVVIVDALRSGNEPGSIHVMDTGPGRPPLAAGIRTSPKAGGTHALGPNESVELARALGRLTGRVVLVGVESSDFQPGAALSEPVARAVPGAVNAVVRALEAARTEADPHVPR
jgi:hydrogenase maturation protease